MQLSTVGTERDPFGMPSSVHPDFLSRDVHQQGKHSGGDPRQASLAIRSPLSPHTEGMRLALDPRKGWTSPFKVWMHTLKEMPPKPESEVPKKKGFDWGYRVGFAQVLRPGVKRLSDGQRQCDDMQYYLGVAQIVLSFIPALIFGLVRAVEGLFREIERPFWREAEANPSAPKDPTCKQEVETESSAIDHETKVENPQPTKEPQEIPPKPESEVPKKKGFDWGYRVGLAQVLRPGVKRLSDGQRRCDDMQYYLGVAQIVLSFIPALIFGLVRAVEGLFREIERPIWPEAEASPNAPKDPTCKQEVEAESSAIDHETKVENPQPTKEPQAVSSKKPLLARLAHGVGTAFGKSTSFIIGLVLYPFLLLGAALDGLGFPVMDRWIRKIFIYHPTDVDVRFLANKGWTAQRLPIEPDVALMGLVRPAPKPVPNAPWLILFGANGFSTYQNQDILHAIGGDQPVGLVNFAYRGYDGSGGTASQEALLRDARTTIEALQTKYGVRPEQLILIGQSLGSGIAADLAAHLSRQGTPPQRLIMISPYTSMRRVADETIPILPVGWAWPDPYDTEAIIEDVMAPVDLYHGEDDVLISPDHSHTLKKQLGDRASLQIVPNRGHNDIWSPKFAEQIAQKALFP